MFRALFATLVAAQVAYSRIPEERRVPATRAIVCLMLATSLAEAAQARGRRGVGMVAGAGALGFGVELTGVATGRPFGHYTYGPGLGPQVGRVPLLAAAAWAMMARPAWVVAGLVARTPLARVVTAAGALTAWDVFLDPRMVREGYWTWPAGGRYEDVPLSNFAGWFVTGVGVMTALDALLPAAADPDAALVGEYAYVAVMETVGFAGFFRDRTVAAVGGGAMMPLAVLAARRMRRAR